MVFILVDQSRGEWLFASAQQCLKINPHYSEVIQQRVKTKKSKG
ncbi:MAG: hypothetical protein AB4080_19920 [Trichodesmium sp.]